VRVAGGLGGGAKGEDDCVSCGALARLMVAGRRTCLHGGEDAP
jgi:hypothetical protein